MVGKPILKGTTISGEVILELFSSGQKRKFWNLILLFPLPFKRLHFYLKGLTSARTVFSYICLHKFLANENFPRPGIILFRDNSYILKSIQEDSPEILDKEVIAMAIEMDLIILTFDRDF